MVHTSQLLLSQHWQYLAYLGAAACRDVVRVTEHRLLLEPSSASLAGLDPAVAALQQHLGQCEARLRSGSFAVGVRELLGHYMTLEELYLEDTTDMAIRIDEVVSGTLTSSMVDDVFFILKKCGSRALATQSIHCACAVVGQLNDLMANKFKAAVMAKLSGGPGKLLAAAPALPGTTDTPGEGLAAAGFWNVQNALSIGGRGSKIVCVADTWLDCFTLLRLYK